MARLVQLCVLYFTILLPIYSYKLLSPEKQEYWKLIQEQNRKEATVTETNRLQDTPCSTNTPADPVEVANLKKFYTTTGGANWIKSDGWLKGDPCKDQWYGVCCNDDGTVAELNLPSNQLVGEFPGFMSAFSKLSALRLSSNYLGGTIPLDLFLMKTVEIIDLEYNQLKGALPDKLDMASLKNLSLSRNKLGGFLPTEWNVPKLQVLSLASNRFEGPLPTSLQTLTYLQLLDLSSNSLSGYLPQEYGSLVSLEYLWLFENQFDNPEIPSSWLEMRAMRNFQMNGLGGEVPTFLGNRWQDLEVLILVNGSLVGSIPSSLCNLKRLQYLHIFYNNISGSIPECICTSRDSSLISIDLSNNLMSGPIPDCIGNLKNLRYIYLSKNGLTGSIPISLGELDTLYSLDLSTNRLSGSIPLSLSSLKSSLNQLDLSTNYFSSIDNGLEPLFKEVGQRSCNINNNPLPCPTPEYIVDCGSPRCSKCNTGGNHTSCSVCVKNGFICGWCDEIPNCLFGYSSSPYYPYTCKTSEWHFGKDSKCKNN